MRTIQEKALDLFDERGSNAVTMEEIAAAAEVSPSSVYRYFGTKEGLIVADEFDSWSRGGRRILDIDDPVGSLLQVVLSYEAAPGPSRQRPLAPGPLLLPGALGTHGRLRRPRPRQPAHRPADDDRRPLTETQARVAANALVFGYFGALEQWYLDGGVHPIAHYVAEGLEPLRRIWPTRSA